MMALRAGNEPLAKEALARKRERDELVATLKDQWTKQKTAVEQLKTALRLLSDKIEEAARKKNVLIARKKRAEAQKAIQETMTGLRDPSAFETFDRMAQKIDQIEAEAEAQTDLAKEMSGDTLAAKFDNLERNQGGEDDLVALKRKMGILPAEAPSAAPPVQARVETPATAGSGDQEELAAALAELESEGNAQQKRKAQR
jgi:phage shock protein A